MAARVDSPLLRDHLEGASILGQPLDLTEFKTCVVDSATSTCCADSRNMLVNQVQLRLCLLLEHATERTSEDLRRKQIIDMHLQKPTFRPVSHTEPVVTQIILDLGIEALIVPFAAYNNIRANEFLIAFVIIVFNRRACGHLRPGWQHMGQALVDF
jgi:hypothetical protein